MTIQTAVVANTQSFGQQFGQQFGDYYAPTDAVATPIRVISYSEGFFFDGEPISSERVHYAQDHTV
ncbi:MAG: hypothetical protein JWO07_208 [Candidatus Saccharibacteria bacterium]|nr:hypothetical protein [Candidatus Saccharibacteria bacterium]